MLPRKDLLSSIIVANILSGLGSNSITTTENTKDYISHIHECFTIETNGTDFIYERDIYVSASRAR